jgi:hypothetical protein
VLRIRDPDLGRGKILIRNGKIIRIRDEHPRSFFRKLLKQFFGLKILEFFDADPGIFFYPRSGMEKFGSGIRYKHNGSATLLNI